MDYLWIPSVCNYMKFGVKSQTANPRTATDVNSYIVLLLSVDAPRPRIKTGHLSVVSTLRIYTSIAVSTKP